MTKETEMIRPKYYLDKRGHDLFWHFERGKVINHDWIKTAQKALQGILGRG